MLSIVEENYQMTQLETGLLVLTSLYAIVYFHEAGHYVIAHAVGFENIKMKTNFFIPHCVEFNDPIGERSRFILVALSGMIFSMFPVVLIAISGIHEWVSLLIWVVIVGGFSDLQECLKVMLMTDGEDENGNE